MRVGCLRGLVVGWFALIDYGLWWLLVCALVLVGFWFVIRFIAVNCLIDCVCGCYFYLLGLVTG